MALFNAIKVWLNEIGDAPGVAGGRPRVIARAARWKAGNALGYKSADVSVGPAKFRARSGYTEASGLIYAGFLEWNETVFVVRYLRPGDTFLDIGANIGTYSVIAATFVPGVSVVSVEPSASEHECLIENLKLNDLPTDAAIAKAVGGHPGTVRFTIGLDTMNSVATDDAGETLEVEQVTVDQLAAGRSLDLIKVDVEGLELEVFRGAVEQLASWPGPTLIFELNGLCRRFGIEPEETCDFLKAAGYDLFEYDGAANVLVEFDGRGIPESHNLIATTDPDAVIARLTSADLSVNLTRIPVRTKLLSETRG